MDLHQAICESFNFSELNQLCFDLGIDYQEIKGETKEEKAREMIQYFDRRGKLHQLIFLCKTERKEVDWDKLLTAYTAGKSRNSHVSRQVVAGSSLLLIVATMIMAFLFGGTVAVLSGLALITILVVVLIILVIFEPDK